MRPTPLVHTRGVHLGAMKTVKDKTRALCPRCCFSLAPVHARKDPKRRPIGYACPEPYCDYFLPEEAEPAVLFAPRHDARMNRAG